MKEVWKDIEGVEGIYQVSNFGNVLSLNYKNHGYSRQLVPKCNNSGRLWVELFKEGKRKPMLIHRLVAMAFIPNPNKFEQINHKDENAKNNRVENLEWCTQKYNIQYYLDRHPGKPKVNYSSNYKKRMSLKVNQYTREGKLIKTWENSRQVAVEKGWSDWSVSECCRNKRKSAYGFIWQYAN